MAIDQKIEEFTDGSNAVVGGGRSKNSRVAKTEVVVKDKDTIAMGGLMRNNQESRDSKVPLLGDIPVLGWLFKKTERSNRKSNLILFLTPRIIDPYQQVGAANTKRVIKERDKNLGSTVDKSKFHEDKLTEITRKMDRQAKGELEQEGDLTDYAQSEVAPGQVQKDELEVPNYKEMEAEIK